MKASAAVFFLGACALIAWAPGCGGGGASDACGKVEPCGGAVVGTWTVADSCLSSTRLMSALPAELTSLCPQATIDAVHSTSTGTMSYKADGTYSMNVTVRGTGNLNVPQSCLSGTGVTCATLTTLLNLAIAQNSATAAIQSVSCTGTAGCVCVATPVPQVIDEAGTYSTAGTLLLTTAAGATFSGAQPYCVQGDSLHLLSTTSATSTSGAGGAPATNGSDVSADLVGHRG